MGGCTGGFWKVVGGGSAAALAAGCGGANVAGGPKVCAGAANDAGAPNGCAATGAGAGVNDGADMAAAGLGGLNVGSSLPPYEIDMSSRSLEDKRKERAGGRRYERVGM